MHIKILGTGCSNCRILFELMKVSVAELGLDATLEKVEDIMEIAAYDILAMPAIVIDETVVLSGKIPTKEEAKDLLS